jgi:hypothetical protein
MHDCAAVDALTAKVDELARTCARLSSENAELGIQLSALFAVVGPAGDVPAAHSRAVDVQETAHAGEPSAEQPASSPPDGRWQANGSGTARISRRAAVGAALVGAAAGIAGASAELTARTPTARIAATDAAKAELTVADQIASPTATGSVISATLSSASPALAGTNTNSGAGVAGTNTGSGSGVAGISSRGRGGIFSGAVAQIQLNPGAASHPRSGWRGDLYADNNGRLWYCKKTGATALWHQIA